MAKNQNNILPEERVTPFERLLKSFRISRLGGFLLSLISAVLLLYTSTISSTSAAIVLTIALGVLVLALIIIRLREERKYKEGLEGWGWLGMLVFGFGIGTLIYMSRGAWVWLWEAMQKIDTARDVIYIGLFLFGIMMGVFVVRVWNKEQDEFLKSIVAVLAGAVLSPLLGKAVDGEGANTTDYAFGLYFLGFVISAPINIIACWYMLSKYSRNNATYLRSGLDFMYGKDKAKAVDRTLLENFFENRDTARLLLGLTLKKYREIIKTEYAERLQKRWDDEIIAPKIKQEDPDRAKEGQKCNRRRFYYQLIAFKEVTNNQAAGPPANQPGPNPPAPNQPPPNPPPSNPPPPKAPAGDTQNKLYDVTFRKIDRIVPEMFRVGVTVKWAENLEYVIAPGTFSSHFPIKGSVAGLALNSRRVIVIERDSNKIFPSSEVVEGRTPKQMQQPRGFQEARYLSYISIPIVSDLGNPEELEIGVVNIDSVLFATETEMGADQEQEIATARLTLEQLRAYASNLHDEIDEPINSLRDIILVIEPILRLYLLARQGTS